MRRESIHAFLFALCAALPCTTSTAAAQGCGSGGPGGNFDWYIPAGTTLVVDTSFDIIVGGPGGSPTASQNVIGGVIDVRDLVVEQNALLVFQGPNPATILASRDVRIEGRISLDGGDSLGVSTLNTTNQPELGARGHAGGGDGGVGSYLTNQSTPRGGNGLGAFQLVDGGGQGGETGYSAASKNERRGAGGGGGRFGPDVYAPFSGASLRVQSLIGMDAEPGFAGGAGGLGAESQSARARGGRIGASPFSNDIRGDEFFGNLVTDSGSVITGELTSLWAGSGGGAGGDAVNSDSFPLVPFTSSGDEKGAGGGGGAGAIAILAEGDLRIGVQGQITADGGDGGGGENTSFFDRVGGGSGGGSGGHIVLQTQGKLYLDGYAADAGTNYDDGSSPASDRIRPISARGGQGGAGRDDQGGARADGQTLWSCDAVPLEYFQPGVVSPPLDQGCFKALPGVGPGSESLAWDDPDGVASPGAGGDGSPGLIQLHVNSVEDIVLPAGALGDATKVFSPPPVGWSNGRFRARLAADLCTALPATGGPCWGPADEEARDGSDGDEGELGLVGSLKLAARIMRLR